MPFNKIFFVGFFLNHENKVAFADHFQCKDRVFLESSIDFLESNTKRVKYFPAYLYFMKGRRVLSLLFNKAKLDRFFIKLYRRDLRIFLHSHINAPLPEGRQSFFLYIFWVFRSEYKRRSVFSFSALFTSLRKIIKREVFLDLESSCDIKALKLLAFRLAFLSGYIYCDKLLSKLNPGSDDLFIMWGADSSGSIFLIDRLKKAGINYFITEYGELPGTVSVNKNGIFGDSYIADNWPKVVDAEVGSSEIGIAKAYIDHVESSQSSSREEVNCDGAFSLYQFMYSQLTPKQIKGLKKVIYVSGVELITSGHLFNKDYVTAKTINANEILLRDVRSHFNTDDYMIIYKDHPLMQKNYVDLTLNASDFPDVFFLNSTRVDDLVAISDITITLPSKVAMTSLLYRKPVYVYGKFSITDSVPELGYYTGNNIGDVKRIIGNTKIDNDFYTKVVAHLINNYLVCVDPELFEQYSFEVEQRKLENIIHDQISQVN
ncbi:hypothetical protein ACFL4I_01205 [Pseudomonadota bacterium]